jgi:hypothetical protein
VFFYPAWRQGCIRALLRGFVFSLTAPVVETPQWTRLYEERVKFMWIR